MTLVNLGFVLNEGDYHFYLSSKPDNYMSKRGIIIVFETFFSVILLNSTVIPISLSIALEVAKIFQAWHVSLDAEMISPIKDDDGEIVGYQPCKVNCSALNEELG